MLVYDDSINFACHETSWVIDSGASVHTTSHADFFTSYTLDDFGSVKLRNDRIGNIIGVGNVSSETTNGTILVLKNVRHIPDISVNIISIGKLDDEGYCNTFNDDHWKLIRGFKIVAPYICCRQNFQSPSLMYLERN